MAAADLAVDVRAAAAPAVVGRRRDNTMTPDELVEQIRILTPDNLRAAVLYGSAVAGDHIPETSNYNILLVLDRLDIATLDAIAKPAAKWARAGNRPPLLFTVDQLKTSADSFPIELLDIQQTHRMLFGDDPLTDIAIEREHLRLQLERELRSKLLTLREHYLLTGGRPRHVASLLQSSVTGFLVLLRAALRLFQEDVPAQKIEAVQLLAKHIPFDPQPLFEVDAMRRRRRKWGETVPSTLFQSYLTTLEKAVEAIDRHLHP